MEFGNLRLNNITRSLTQLEYKEETIVIIFCYKSLQEKATKWSDNHEIDGLTTNGVLIMHPRGDFCGGSATCGPWRETSVGGAVFSLRESRSAQQKVLIPTQQTEAFIVYISTYKKNWRRLI